MASYEKKNTWMAVPQFGGWDQKTGSLDYTMVFSQARTKRQQYKNEVKKISLGNEEELMAYHRYQTGSETYVPKKRKLRRCFSCFAKA